MKLTQKQQAFVEAYLQSFNATQAAIRAGYSQKTAYSIGSENLRKPEIKAAVDTRMAELKMGSNEVLLRLAEHARGDMGEFIRVSPLTGEPVIDFGKAEMTNKLRLVKRFKVKKKKGEGWDETEIELELYDAQRALELIGKHHGAFPNKVEVDWKRELADAGLNPDDELEKLADEFVKHLTSGAGEAAPGRVEEGKDTA